MKMKIIICFLTLAMLMMAVAPAMACSPSTSNNTAKSGYREITGTLSGANFVFRVPYDWNGKLIIGCPSYQYPPNPNCQYQYDTLASMFIAQGFAYAATNYGASGWCVKQGLVSVYQLTEYLIDRYHVRSNIFLLGGSMGGNIALLLGDKYPMLYSGVLDICGVKDGIGEYNYAQIWLTNTPADLRVILNIPSLVSDSDIQGLQAFFSTVTSDSVKAMGGTPDQTPQIWQRFSPVLHADIHIPVISVVGEADPLVPLPFDYEYQTAVANAGQSNLYRLYVVPNGGHLDAITLAQVPAHLSELIAWSASLHKCYNIHMLQ
jgi:pimeloyl-ACP methyl ester carboxylesterase